MFNVIRQHCCGLDVHQAIVWACLMIVQEDGSVTKTIRSFTTFTSGLLKLRDWLLENQCQDVVMESTGIYWKPIYNILEGAAEITLANAHQVKNLPGRKTDVKDCEWLAQMHLCGLVRGSFVPPRPIRDLRELTRRRQKLVNNVMAETNRIQKILEDANIKLSSVVSKIWGVSCRQMIEALISGGYTPEEMANFARGRMRRKLPELKEALMGKITDDHRFILTQCMQHIQFLEMQITEIEEEIDEKLKADPELYECLMSIPFFDKVSVAGFIAEMGNDMLPFATGEHAASWAGVCPGNRESAGKRKSGKTRPGNKHLECLAVQVAWAAVRRKDTYLRAKFQRLAYRRGQKKAIVAIAHSIIKIVYHIIKEHVCYMEPETKEPSEQQKKKITEKHIKALERLGYKVDLNLAPVTEIPLQAA
jgi:transposase